MSYAVHNMHWYKTKPAPTNGTYVGRPRANQPWPALANLFVYPGIYTRFIMLDDRERTPKRKEAWLHRLRFIPGEYNGYVFESLDPLADFRRWLWNMLKRETTPAWNAINALANAEDGVLLCWCAPEPCHAEIIASAVDWFRTRQ